MNCSQCGTPLQPGWTVCPKCGQQFAQPVPYPTAPQPAAKKPSTFLIGCLGCGALLLVGFVGCAAFMASVGKKASQNIAASTSTSTPSNSTDDQSGSGDSSNVRVMNIPHIGKREVGIVDNVEYCIVKIERRKSIGDSMTSTDADGQFVIVRLAAINNDKKTHSLTTSLMTLQDSQGREFQLVIAG